MLPRLLLVLVWLLPVPAMGDETAMAPTTAVPEISQPFAPPLRMVMDIRSVHSDGRHDLEALAAMAEARGIGVLGVNDHDRFTIRLGVDPIPQMLGYSRQQPSLYESGVESFLTDIVRLRQRHPELLVLAGTESTPGYHWSGIPFRDLTLHDAERHIITLGAETPQQIESLPSFDLRNIHGSRELSLAFWFVVALLLLIVLRRHGRLATVLVAAVVVLAVIALLRKPADADAEFLKVATDEGLFTAWAHPGTLSGQRPGPMGVQLDTPPYSARVFSQPTAEAFAAVYGDTDSNTEPGARWDRYLLDYLHGRQPAPVWGIAAGDFHVQGEANEYLGNYPMDVWATAKTAAAVLQALRDGRCVAWGMPQARNIRVAELYLKPVSGAPLLPGGSVATITSPIELVARLAEQDTGLQPAEQPALLKGEWVVDGKVASSVELPVNGEAVRLPLDLAPGVHAVRLHIPMQAGIRMEANPFLVRVSL
ncbi:MAG TPA: hypothetical protein VNI58_09515 [Mariprofundaceae bacterium]|nr:hypothetical protein [Mariprofundaceae bacterium]